MVNKIVQLIYQYNKQFIALMFGRHEDDFSRVNKFFMSHSPSCNKCIMYVMLVVDVQNISLAPILSV